MPHVFIETFSLVAIAEIADKSRVAGLLLATVYRRPWPVFLGMTLGYVVLDGAAIACGGWLSAFFSPRALAASCGALFAAFGAAGLLWPETVEESARDWLKRGERFGPFAVSFFAIALSEFGDRTQIACAALGARTGRPWPVFAGAISALAGLNALTVWLGERISRRIPARSAQNAASTLFLGLGAALLVKSAFFR